MYNKNTIKIINLYLYTGGATTSGRDGPNPGRTLIYAATSTAKVHGLYVGCVRV